VLDTLLRSGDEPVAILAQITAHVREVWRARAAVAQRLDARQAVSLFPRRRPDWVIERLMARAASWGGEGLAQATARCFDADQRLKSGGGEARALLTVLVAEIARGAGARQAPAGG
jgi:DNA polymerase III delta subunit